MFRTECDATGAIRRFRRTQDRNETPARVGGGRPYRSHMRRLIAIDERELAAARAELGTSSVEDTVSAALREVAAVAARLRELRHERDAASN